MLGKINKVMHRHVTYADIIAPVTGKVQELRDFSKTRHELAIELRIRAEQLQEEAQAHALEAANAETFADRLEGALYA